MKEYLQKADFILLGLTAFAFPFWQRRLPLLIGMWIVIRITRLFFETPKFQRIGYPIVSGAFYLLYMTGLFYSSNWDYGLFDLEVKSTFLLLPFFFTLYPISQKSLDHILLAFTGGILVASVFCGLEIHGNYFEHDHNTNYLFGSHFSIFMHPGYFALYIDLAVFAILFFLLERKIEGGWKKGMLVFALLIMLFSLFFTGSKAGILGLFLLILLWGGWYVWIQRSFKKGSLLIGGAMLLVLGLWFLFPRVVQRFEKALKKNQIALKAIDKSNPSSTETRLLSWSSGWEVYKKQPVFGTGTGDIKDELMQHYQSKGYTSLEKHKINCHSQYLQTGVALGIPGLSLLLTIFCFLMWIGWKERNVMLLGVVCLISIVSLFESIFETQAGVVFFNFFVNLFLGIKK